MPEHGGIKIEIRLSLMNKEIHPDRKYIGMNFGTTSGNCVVASFTLVKPIARVEHYKFISER